MKPFNLSQHLTRNEINVHDFGAVADGVADDRAAIAACDALGAFAFTRGLYRVGANLTITNLATFEPGARLVIPDGVTVTFANGLIGPDQQIFNLAGSGAVAGLKEAWLEWFAGDAKGSLASPPTLDARPAINAWAAALANAVNYPVEGTTIARAGPGIWLMSGAVATHFYSGFEGAGSGQTVFRISGTVTNGFIFDGQRGKVSGFQILPAVPGTIPTAGVGCMDLRRNTVFEDIIVNDCWIGWDDDPQLTTSNSYYNCRTDGCLSIGVRQRGQEKHWHDCHIVAIPDWSTITGMSGAFNVGDAVSIGGNTGLITNGFGGGKFKIMWNGAEPAPPVAISDTTTGATGTLSSNTPAHQVAALLWDGTAGGFLGNVTHDGDLIGGMWGLVVQGAGSANSPTSNPCWTRTASNFCVDTTYRGSKIDKAFGMDLRGWFASTRNRDAAGLTVTNYGDLRLNSLQIVNNSGRGLYINTDNAYFCEVIHPMFNGNCWNISSTNGLAELVISGPASVAHDVVVTGGKMGYADLYGRTPNLGLYVGKLDHTAGMMGTRLAFVGVNCAAGKSAINATQINTTDQRIRVSCCVAIPDA